MPDKATILLVDDDNVIRVLVEKSLAREGYEVLSCETGEQALEIAQSKPPSLIILDLMLPGIDGLQVCRKLKSIPKTENIPIIMLTARNEEADIVTGLELGADDYVTKPFSGAVLAARVRRILRRISERSEQIERINIHDLTIDTARREVLVENQPVELTFTQFNMLHVLASRPGMVFTRAKIVGALHDSEYPVTERAVDVHIASLRKKLGPCGKYIETVRGVGYRFQD